MKKLLLIPALVILVLGLWMAVLSFRRPADLDPPQLVGACQARGPLSVGVGSAPIDLPPSSTIGGFPRFRWSAVGQRDPLAVRALVVGEPGCSAALVSAEILLVPWALTAAVEERTRSLGLGFLVLAATHTHAGPGGYWDSFLGSRLATGPYEPSDLSRIAEAAARAVAQAQGALQPVRIQVGVSDARDLVQNRELAEPDGRLVRIRFSDVNGRTVAEVALLGAHPTMLGSRNRLLSGDWPGALMRTAGFPLLFFQGALGDQSTRAPPASGGTPEAYARALEERLREAPLGEPDAQPFLGVGRAAVTLPALSPGAVPGPLRAAVGRLFPEALPAAVRVTAVRLGPVTLLAVPAEPVEEVARAWRAAVGPGSEILSLADDYAGYVEAPGQMERGEGETRRTYYGPRLADRLLAAAAAAARAARAGR